MAEETRTRTVALRRSPARSWPENFELVNELFDYFDRQGARNVAASRIAAYRNAFATFRHAAEAGERMPIEKAENVIQTMVEFQQLTKIMEAAKNSVRSSAWLKQLKKLASGVAYATQESGGPSARDTQFECYLAAVFELSGCSIMFAEPDVVVTHSELTFGVAAKRPRGTAGFEKNLRGGARQVAAFGHPGIVALDLSAALLRGTCITPADGPAAITFVEHTIDEFIAAEHPRIERFVAGRAIAALLCLQVPALVGIPHRPQLMTATCWRYVTLTDKPQLMRAIAKIANDSQHGLFGPPSQTEITESSTA